LYQFELHCNPGVVHRVSGMARSATGVWQHGYTYGSSYRSSEKRQAPAHQATDSWGGRQQWQWAAKVTDNHAHAATPHKKDDFKEAWTILDLGGSASDIYSKEILLRVFTEMSLSDGPSTHAGSSSEEDNASYHKNSSCGKALEEGSLPPPRMQRVSSIDASCWNVCEEEDEVVDSYDSPPACRQAPGFELLSDDSLALQTTVVVRGFPLGCTRQMLLNELNASCKGKFDFLYMPVDASQQPVGYAIVNFKESLFAAAFIEALQAHPLKVAVPDCDESQVCEVDFAPLQGLATNMAAISRAGVMQQLAEVEEWQPLIFDEAGQPMQFPRHAPPGIGDDLGLPSDAALAADLGDAELGRKARGLDLLSSCEEARHRQEVPQVHAGPACSEDHFQMPPVEPGFCGTLMLRDIPNRYTSDMLIDCLMSQFKGKFDFLYLPIDFKNECNVGYAFINFTDVDACQLFFRNFHRVEANTCLPRFKSNKICHLTPARVQGQAANVAHLLQSSIVDQLLEKPAWQPLVFDGHGNASQFLVKSADAPKNRKSKRKTRTSSWESSDGAQHVEKSPTLGEAKDQLAHSEGSPVAGKTAAEACGELIATEIAEDDFEELSNVVMAEYEELSKAALAWLSEFDASLADSKDHRGRSTRGFRGCARVEGSDTVDDGVTAMLRNIPSSCSRDMLLHVLNVRYHGNMDFLYLPVDFESGLSVGYGFINFKDRAMHARFVEDFHGSDSRILFAEAFTAAGVDVSTAQPRSCRVTYARLQGLAANVLHFRRSAIMRQLASVVEWQPLVVDPNGTPIPLSLMPMFSGYRPGAETSGTGSFGFAGFVSPLQRQVEYYFSADNLAGDFYLRRQMDEDGWVLVSLIASFPKVKQILSCDEDTCLRVLMSELMTASSAVLEMSEAGDRVRPNSKEIRAAWPRLEGGQEEFVACPLADESSLTTDGVQNP